RAAGKSRVTTTAAQSRASPRTATTRLRVAPRSTAHSTRLVTPRHSSDAAIRRNRSARCNTPWTMSPTASTDLATPTSTITDRDACSYRQAMAVMVSRAADTPTRRSETYAPTGYSDVASVASTDRSWRFVIIITGVA